MPRGSSSEDIITVDGSATPLVRVTLVRTPTSAQLDAAIARLDAVLRARVSFAMVVDIRSVGVLSAAFRARIVEWFLRQRAVLAELCIGSACLVDTPYSIALFDSMRWLHRGRIPMVAMRHESQAAAWVDQQRALRLRDARWRNT